MDLLDPGMTDNYDPGTRVTSTPSYAGPSTIAAHQAVNAALYRQHNPAGRMNDLTRPRYTGDLTPHEAGDGDDEEPGTQYPVEAYVAQLRGSTQLPGTRG